MPDHPAPGELPTTARLRSGTAARLSGVPVATLRVWERRYGVVAAPKTATGQRQYTPQDVQRLRLLRQLTERGHAIGSIAGLAYAPLQALWDDAPPPATVLPAPAAGPLRLVVVGRSAAHKLRAESGLVWLAVFDDLDAAETPAAPAAQVGQAGPADAPDVLLVHLPSLQPASAQRLRALATHLRAKATMVLYAFGAEAVADSLRTAGAVVRREPIGGRELVRLLAATRAPGPARASTPALPAGAQATPRRYSDEDLASLAELPTTVACECPRHLAEIVLQLAGFERYSADCLSRSPADAALHQHLSGLAATARDLFEQALERVVADEGLVLPVPAG